MGGVTADGEDLVDRVVITQEREKSARSLSCSQQCYVGGTILQMGKLRQRKIQSLVQSHTAGLCLMRMAQF